MIYRLIVAAAILTAAYPLVTAGFAIIREVAAKLPI